MINQSSIFTTWAGPLFSGGIHLREVASNFDTQDSRLDLRKMIDDSLLKIIRKVFRSLPRRWMTFRFWLQMLALLSGSMKANFAAYRFPVG